MTIGTFGRTSARTVAVGHRRSGGNCVQESARELLRSVWEETALELSRLACAMGIAPGRVDDVLQDVYLIAWRKGPADADAAQLRRWLLRVTTNRCNLEHRRRTRWRNVWGAVARRWSGCDRAGSAADAVCRTEERQRIRRALGRLKPPWRSVLVLRYFAEFDSKQIGKILELPDSTVRSQLRAARKQLALELERMGYPDES